jgi:hypothetical protein
VEKTVELAYNVETFAVETVRLEPNMVEKTVSFACNDDTTIVDTLSNLAINESAVIGVVVFNVYTLIVETSI